jgi:prepilin-type N-terminal cleavage/methylation domain-containing protein
MLERMKNVLKNRKAEGDKGFSLVELAVVIVIIGILVAIAIPVFIGMQSSAEDAADNANAANGASVVAAEVARQGGEASGADVLALLAKMDPAPTLEVGGAAATATSNVTLENYCVTAGAASQGPEC